MRQRPPIAHHRASAAATASLAKTGFGTRGSLGAVAAPSPKCQAATRAAASRARVGHIRGVLSRHPRTPLSSFSCSWYEARSSVRTSL